MRRAGPRLPTIPSFAAVRTTRIRPVVTGWGGMRPPGTSPIPRAADDNVWMISAIDGPSGAGKGTVARTLAARLGYTHIDTGAMYRAVAWMAGHNGIDLHEI